VLAGAGVYGDFAGVAAAALMGCQNCQWQASFSFQVRTGLSWRPQQCLSLRPDPQKQGVLRERPPLSMSVIMAIVADG